MPTLSNNDLTISIRAIDNATATLRKVSASMESAGGSANGFSASLARVRDVALGVYLPQLANKVFDVGRAALQSAGDYEQSRVAFDTMLGSADKAQRLLTDISNFAKSTPFELPEVVTASKQLLAFGVAQQDIIPTMRRLGDIAAGVGVPVGQLSYVFGQVRLSGKLMAQDLMQFTNAGVPLLDYLSQTMHKTTTQIKADMDKGAGPSFQQVQVAIEAMTNAGGKFGGMMDKQSQTFQGVMSNIGDSFGQIGRAALGMDTAGNIVKNSFFDRIKTAANNLMPRLQDLATGVGPAVQEAMQHIDDIFNELGPKIADVAKQISGYLGPKFSELFKVVNDDVVPVLNDLLKNVVPEVSRVLGTVLVGAIGLAVDSLKDIIKFTKEHSSEIKATATAITAFLLPALVRAGIQSALTAKQMVVDSLTARTGWVVAAAQSSAAWWLHFGKIVAAGAVTVTKSIAHAVAVGAKWVAQAAVASTAWVVTELPKIVAMGSVVALKAAVHAADTALAWTVNAVRVSFVWVTQELPKLVVGFARTATAATVHATAASATWVAQAAVSSVAWVTTELPKIVAGFVITSASAVTEAAVSSATWVASAAASATAWLVTELPRIIAAFVAMSASAIANAAIATTAWVTSAVTSSASFAALSALVATPMVMPAIAIAAALASIVTVIQAVQSAQKAISAMNDAAAAKASLDQINAQLRAEAQKAYSAGNKAKGDKLMAAANIKGSNAPSFFDQLITGTLGKFAGGTNYAPGGLSLVGESGPEFVDLPRGSRVYTNSESKQIASRSQSGGQPITVTQHIYNNADMSQAWTEIAFKLRARA